MPLPVVLLCRRRLLGAGRPDMLGRNDQLFQEEDLAFAPCAGLLQACLVVRGGVELAGAVDVFHFVHDHDQVGRVDAPG